MHGWARHPFYRNRLRVDPSFRLEVSYCVEKGIPHDKFLEWDPSSRAKALAYLMEQSETCQLCGTAPWEWNENKFAYDAEETFCKGCYVKEVSAEGEKRMPGTRIELVPVTKELRDRQMIRHRRRAGMDMGSEED